jgi:hypothetical protein
MSTQARSDLGAAMTCKPGHAPRHDDFGTGNTESLKHGADSPRTWRPLADRLEAELLAERPWLTGHRRTVKAWARTEAQVQLLGVWLDEHGLVDDAGEPRPAGHRLDRLETRAQSLRNDLAEPPMAMAKLLQALTSTAVAGGAPDLLDGLKAEAAGFVERYLATLDPVAALELPPASKATEDRS